MEKFKIKLRDAKKLDPVSVSYCKMFNLLRDSEPFAYYANNYGWRFDLYEVNGVYISTGYGPVGKEISREANEKIKALESEAKKLYSNIPDYEERAAKRAELLKKACALLADV